MALTASGVKNVIGLTTPVYMTTNEAVEKGDLVTADGYKAVADGSTGAEFVAGHSCASGGTLVAYEEAILDGTDSTQAPYGGAGAETVVYLSDTAGDFAESEGTVSQVVGVELSATRVLLRPKWADGSLKPAATKIWFRDIGIYIYSSADGILSLIADGSIDINDKVSFFSWGAVVDTAYHFYMNSFYNAYIGSSATNVLIVGTSAGTIEFRCGAHGAAVTIDNNGLYTQYLIRTTGILDFGASHTGVLKLPQRGEPITQPAEGTIWYNTTDDKLEFATASGMEQVTSG